MTILPCGCAKCGCLCADHASDRIETPCTRHAIGIIGRALAGELGTIVVLGLFVSTVAVWAGLWGFSAH